eukprot:1157922-Pelagomonas_calceolata.AAC.1
MALAEPCNLPYAGMAMWHYLHDAGIATWQQYTHVAYMTLALLHGNNIPKGSVLLQPGVKITAPPATQPNPNLP